MGLNFERGKQDDGKRDLLNRPFPSCCEPHYESGLSAKFLL